MDSRERTNIRALGIAHLFLAPCFLLGAYFFVQMMMRDKAAGVGEIAFACYLGGAGVALLLSGIGIMARKKWALPFMFVAGLAQLPAVPVGTAIGGWTLAVHSKLSKRKNRRS